VPTDNGPSGSGGEKQQQQQQQQEEEDDEAGAGSALPLVHFSSSLPSNGRLLRALEGQTQLTDLQLCLTSSGKPAAGCGAALATLTSLCSLTLSADSQKATGSRSMLPVPSPLPLQHLTCLAHLSLS
jgi:hypothetical protein